MDPLACGVLSAPQHFRNLVDWEVEVVVEREHEYVLACEPVERRVEVDALLDPLGPAFGEYVRENGGRATSASDGRCGIRLRRS